VIFIIKNQSITCLILTTMHHAGVVENQHASHTETETISRTREEYEVDRIAESEKPVQQ
jgi:hypothetical protein